MRVRLAWIHHLHESRVCRELLGAQSDEHGRYVLSVPELGELPEYLLARAHVQVSATADGYERGVWSEGDPRSCRDGELTLDCEVMPFAGLHGRVVDRGGAPVAGAWVLARSPDGAIEKLVETDSEGNFWLTCDPAATLQVGAGHAAHGFSRVREFGSRARPGDSPTSAWSAPVP